MLRVMLIHHHPDFSGTLWKLTSASNKALSRYFKLRYHSLPSVSAESFECALYVHPTDNKFTMYMGLQQNPCVTCAVSSQRRAPVC